MSETPAEMPKPNDDREKAPPIFTAAEPNRETAPKQPFFYSPIIDTD